VTLKSEDGDMLIKPGDAVGIPAIIENLKLETEGEAGLLEIYIQ